MEFKQAVEILWKKLGNYKIMALASSVDDYPMIRNVSCIFYHDRIYFKTDKNFRKTQQMLQNNKVAMCFHGVSLEGIAKNTGLVIDEPGRIFEKKYQEYLWQSYNAYSHVDTEILIEVEPKFVEIWDDDENKNAYQIFINFDTKEVEVKKYD
ncbi:MAG: pyridoxamine 5'-phosphate oxidase family protein [Erysipelotrichaceae bacterium]|nr:pyridoxamine 5'-phosphate oxidase family protein [Erysipelotrichaceae bacterium]MBQ7888270.1 pyridoxamine 5'-phosphate oxidase family protein [Erysipelotrichaceae bacterium]